MADPFNGRSKNPRLRLFVGVIVLLGAVGLVAYHARWVRSVFQGPVPVTVTTLEDLKDPETLTNPWVSFAFNEAIDTGFVMESTDLGQTAPRSKYLLIRIGNRWLLADVPVAFTGNQVVGYLDKWWSPLSKQVIDQVRGRFPDHDILPCQLNMEYSYKGECFAILGIAAFIFLVGLWIIGLAASDMSKIRRISLNSPRSQPPTDEGLTENWKS